MTRTVKLDPVALAVAAFRRLWQARDHALRLGLPLLALGVAWNVFIGNDLPVMPMPDGDTAPMPPEAMLEAQLAILKPLALYMIPGTVLFAILIGNLTRLLLIGPAATNALFGLAFDRRLLAVIGRFLQSVLATLVAIFLISIPFSLLLGLATAGGMVGAGIGLVAFMAMLLVTLAIWLRLSVAAYATAIDRPMRLIEAWRLTAGNAIALLGAYLAVNIPVVAASAIRGGLLEAAAVPLTALLVLNLMALVSSLVSIAVVALALEKLLGSAAPPQTP